jgi:C4-dicarboxylate-specific signal transduction histidine kinase
MSLMKVAPFNGERRRELAPISGSQADEVMLSPNARLWQEAEYLSLGLVALAAVTGLYFWLDWPLVSAAFTYLIVIVLLSLVSSFPCLIALSFIAVGCLNYFFTQPIFSFRVDYQQDINALVAFLITSLITSGLVSRLRTEQREHMLAVETLRETQAQLTHLDRLATTGQLTASIVHEVKQPLGATVTNAQAALRWLEHRPPDLEEVRQALNRIVRDGNHANEVIDRIRALIKNAPPRKDRLEINGAIREVIELTHGETVKNGISVRTELADGLPLVQGDRVQLQQVMLNLIINAVQALSGASEGSRELMIGTAKDESRSVLVTVGDSGPGLEAHERLFEPFYTTKPNGLGLGLSICRSIVESHGGRLWATTNEPRGAIFQFTLPVHPA